MEETMILIVTWVFKICIGVTAISIITCGTWIVFNLFVWEILIRHSMRWLKLYSTFAHFIRYHHRYLAWAKKYEGKLEEGAND